MTALLLNALTGSTRGLPKTFWYLWGGSLLNRLGSFVMPMMMMYLTQKRGLSAADAGLTITLFGVGSLAAMQLGGVLADRLGRRATMLLSLCTSAIAMLSLGAASTRAELWLGACALGFTGDLYRPASQALIADIVAPADRVRAFGFLYWAINLGFSFAAVAAGQLARVSFQSLFLIDAGTTLTWALILFRTIPETRPAAAATAHTQPAGAQGSWLTPFFDPTFAAFLVVHLSMTLVFFQFQVALPLDMVAKGLTPADFGLAMALNGVLIVALQPMVTRLLSPFRRSRVLAAACLFVGVGFGLNTFATTLPGYLLSVAVWTMGELIMAPVNASVVADLSPADLRGRYQGAFGLLWSLGMTLGPLLSTRLIAATSINVLWATCLALGLVAAAGQLLLGPARRRRLEAMQIDLVGRAD